jgi:hypothetical protein
MLDGIELCVREYRERANNRQSNEERNQMERCATLNQDQELAFGVTEEQNALEELERTIQRVGERRESNQTSMMNIIESRSRESNRIQSGNGTSRNQNEREGRAKEKGIKRLGEKGAFPRVSFTTKGVIHDQGCLRVRGCEGITMETSPQIQTKTKFKGYIIETSQYLCDKISLEEQYVTKDPLQGCVRFSGSWSPLDL